MLVKAGEAGQKGRNQIGARQVGRRQIGDGGAKRRVDRIAEQQVQQGGQAGVGDIFGQRAIHRRVGGVEQVFVRQTDHHFVDQRVRQARHLNKRPAGGRGGIIAWQRRQRAVGGQAGSGPGPDDAVAVAGHTGNRHFQRQRCHVGVVQFVVGRALGDTPGKAHVIAVTAHRVAFDRHQIDQIENAAKVDGKGFGPLADKHPTRGRTARQCDGKDVLAGVARIVGDRLGANIVDRFEERLAGSVCPHRRDPLHQGRIAVELGQRIAFRLILVGLHKGIAELTGLTQRDRHAFSANRQRNPGAAIGKGGRKLEPIGQIGHGIAVIVDADVIGSVMVQREIVGSAIGGLQRDIVGDKGHEL